MPAHRRSHGGAEGGDSPSQDAQKVHLQQKKLRQVSIFLSRSLLRRLTAVIQHCEIHPYRGHDLNLLGSRDVIGHVNI